MDDMDKSKRALSTPSWRVSAVKRTKTEHCDSPPPLPLSASQGVERIRLPPSLNVKRLSSLSLEQLANERTEVLRRQGRRVVGLPVVLDDGIILNWVRRKSGSHKADDIPPIICQTAAPIAEHKNEKLHLPFVPTARGSGTSTADAMIIDSDEDVSRVSSVSPIVVPRKLPVNHGPSLNWGVIDYSDSDIELLSSVRAENKTASEYDQQATFRSLFAQKVSPENVSDLMSSDSLPSRALTREGIADALFGLRSSAADVRTPNSESDGTDEEVNEGKDIDGNNTSARHAKPPPLPPLQPIKDLLARRKQRGDPTRDVLPGGAIVTPQASQKRGRKEFLKEAPAITSSESDEEPSNFRASDPQLKRVPLPKTVHGRARRLLMPDSAELPLVAVTMRGDCHFIQRKEKHRITGYSLPNPGVFRHVADVCMVGDTAVLGCDKGTDQISFLSVAGKPQMINVTCSPHSSGPRYQDTQRRGVSCLAAVHAEGGHIKFLSGGYDGTIHEWMVGVEKLDEPRSRRVVSYGACIMALAYRDRDRSLVASAQKRLHITDLNRCKTIVHPFSNDIQHIHIHPQAAYLTLLEVRHLDHQIQLYDSRRANFDGEPCLSFGYRSTNSKFPATHTRGSAHLVHFAKASEDGCVLLWDFRNSKRALVERRFQQAEKVVHTIFADRDIATYGQDVVTFFEDYLT